MSLLAEVYDLHKPEFWRARMKRDGLITVLDEIRHGCQVWKAV